MDLLDDSFGAFYYMQSSFIYLSGISFKDFGFVGAFIFLAMPRGLWGS